MYNLEVGVKDTGGSFNPCLDLEIGFGRLTKGS